MDDPRGRFGFTLNRRMFVGVAASVGVAQALTRSVRAQSNAPLPVSIVLRSYAQAVGTKDLADIAKILETQVSRDFAPYWGITATFTVIDNGSAVPDGGWPIDIVDTNKTPLGTVSTNSGHWGIDPIFCGVGPRAKVFYDATLSQDQRIPALIHATSHECLEMLANPYGTMFSMLPSLDADDNSDIGAMLYSQEVCDPVWTKDFAYPIDGQNGPLVSDFVTPRYFDLDRKKVPGVFYSFKNNLQQPLDVGEGCNQKYFSFGRLIWRQMTKTSGQLFFSDLDTSNPNC